MGILIPFKSGEPVEFTEPQVDGSLKAVLCGKVDITEYDTSLYATEDDLKNAVRSNITPIAKESFEHWPADSIITSYSSHGMAMNSGSSGRESVIWRDDGTVLIERTNSSNEEG